jgi:hypothetical protein
MVSYQVQVDSLGTYGNLDLKLDECCNLSLGLVTKAKACKGVGQE